MRQQKQNIRFTKKEKTMLEWKKSADKERAKKDPTRLYRQTPCSLIGELYYKRKMCCYNLSFYELGNGNGTCYLWDETRGKRGSCEVGTCVYMYVTSDASKTSVIEEVTLYSDTCGGQNRNQFVASCVLYIPHNKCINHNFTHSEMECDFIHASIEHAKSLTKVYVPSQ